MANESPTSPQLSHGSCRSSEGRMTACPPDQRRPLRRVSDEEVSLAQHVSHDTAVDDVVACCRPWGGPWAALYPEMLHILLQFTTYRTVLSLYSFTLRRLQHYIVFSFSKMINFHVCILWVKNMPLLRITSANIARFSNHYHCCTRQWSCRRRVTFPVTA